ncbi:hypothetical protein AYO44_15950 [Planctomycetaceae bacterium SCGC AG-212-F19]|nr:hypothetical protein AYO44_15950 [Planctomycetaceae bacterium SCGC AG-212-F19]
MRWHILRTLLRKEILRHLANRGGIVLAVLLVGMAGMLSLFSKHGMPVGPMGAGPGRFIIDYWQDDPWIEHLRQHVPEEWRRDGRLLIRDVAAAPTENDIISYHNVTAAIQIRPQGPAGKGPPYLVWIWYSPANPDALGPFEAWFRKETHAYSDAVLAATFEKTSPTLRAAMPFLGTEERRTPFEGAFDIQSGMATVLVLFSLIMSCLYLMPSMTCEEHERGLLLAQMLSPARASEVLAAKFCFYPVVGVALGAALAGICRPAALGVPFFWAVLAVASLGFVGIGLTIASVAQTQRLASMGAMCYLLVVALVILVAQKNHVPVVPWVLLEFHVPPMLHAAVTGNVSGWHWGQLVGALILALGWSALATWLFRRRGWQ